MLTERKGPLRNPLPSSFVKRPRRAKVGETILVPGFSPIELIVRKDDNGTFGFPFDSRTLG